MQVAPLDLEIVGRPGDIPLVLPQFAGNVLSLEGIAGIPERVVVLGRLRDTGGGACVHCGWGGLQEQRDLRRVDQRARHHDQQPLDQVAQLPDVARPVIELHHFQRLWGDVFDPQPLFLRMHAEKMPGQQRDVLFPLAQRRDHHRQHVQPIEQVVPEIPLLDFLGQILVGGRDDPDVHLDQLGAAHAGELLLFKRPEDLGLRVQAHVPDLVQEQRAAVRLFELPPFHRRGSGEGPALVSEQLALDQRLRNGGAVDRHERMAMARALLMYRARHQLLAGAVLSRDQQAAARGTGRRDQPAKPLHARRGAD